MYCRVCIGIIFRAFYYESHYVSVDISYFLALIGRPHIDAEFRFVENVYASALAMSGTLLMTVCKLHIRMVPGHVTLSEISNIA